MTAAAPPAAPPAEKPPRKPQVIFTFEATRETWLKKAPVQRTELKATEVVRIEAGRRLGVVSTKELHNDAHEFIELAADAGRWFAFAPHFRRLQSISEAMPRVIDWKDFTCLVTPHISVGEVLNFDHRRRPEPGNSNISRIIRTCEEIELVRAAAAKEIGLTALGITSFFRPEPINRQVGGVPGSWHVTGMAVDVYPFGCSLERFFQWIYRRWTGGLGDGRPRGFVHLDRESNGGFAPGAGRQPLRIWNY